MDNKERIELIRRGNDLFNRGDIPGAATIFQQTGYRDGLTRVADHYFFDRRLPLVALKYYRLVNRQDKVREIYDRMVFALGKWLGREPENQPPIPEPKVSPKLKIYAEEILRDLAEKEKNGEKNA